MTAKVRQKSRPTITVDTINKAKSWQTYKPVMSPALEPEVEKSNTQGQHRQDPTRAECSSGVEYQPNVREAPEQKKKLKKREREKKKKQKENDILYLDG